LPNFYWKRRILRCRGFAVAYYGFILGALTPKPYKEKQYVEITKIQSGSTGLRAAGGTRSADSHRVAVCLLFLTKQTTGCITAL
jgi:hypothetical protein